MGTIARFDLGEIINNTGVKAFVETGTLHGDGVLHALKFPFSEIHSIEIDKELADKCIKLFQNNNIVNIHTGHSGDVLPPLLENIKCNCLFWLDAHFPGADCGKARYDAEKNYDIRLPLESEINAIAARVGKYNDVLICDDAWVYEDGIFEWGTFNEHAARHNHGVTKEQLCGKDMSFLYSQFKDTHTFKKVTNDQGYIIVLPK